MQVKDLLEQIIRDKFISTRFGSDDFEYIVKLIEKDLNVDKLVYVVNCRGCGRSITGDVPVPAKDGSIETVCSNCDYLLVSYEYEEKKPGNDAL